ncbi:MAG: hypothetical protein E6I22_03375 [Chloroflexi bacterium]|nr:MAG: hypothetical protein E6I22_03375 [Chloroflexota bacterium]
MASPYFRAKRAPFLIPARVLVVIVGLVAITAAVLHLVDEVQRTESAGIFLLAVIGLGVIWLVSLGLRWRGSRIGLVQLAISVAGVIFLILHAADDLGRGGFGSISPEWVLGGLSTAGHLRRGTFFVIAATLFVLIPFYNLHLASGGVSLGKIASESGMAWALVAAATAVCAGLALAFSLLVLGLQLSVRRRPQGKAPAPALKKA